MLDGLRVGAQDVGAAGKGTDEHQEGRARQVKVRDHRVHHVKTEAGANEKFGRMLTGREMPEGGDVPFERANDRRSGGDDSPPGLLRADDRGCRRRAERVGFGMHHVIVDSLRRHRSKGAQPDVERQSHELDAARREPFEQLRRKVQRCRRCRDAPGNAREDGLIPLLRLRGACVNVRRQRHLAGAGQKLLERNSQLELDLAHSLRELAGNDRFAEGFEQNARAGAQPARRAGQRDPAPRAGVVLERLRRVEQQQFDARVPAGASSEDARGNHARLVEH